jgi:rod shape-determining protein MreC
VRGPRPRLLLVLLVLTALTLTALDARGGTGGPFGALRRGVDTVFGPAQRALGGAAGSAGDALGGLPRLGDAREESARLQRENDELRRRLLDLQGAEATGRELADLLRLKDEGTYATVLARVVAYGTFQPFDATVTLDVGSKDGVREDMSVTSGRGLVGRTVRVGPDTSVVALLTDPTFSVGTRLNRTPRSFGLTSGQGDGLRFQLVELSDGSQLQAGDDLVTAGSDTFPPGIPVGRVTAVDSATSGQVRTARVAPYADLGALDLLQVVVEGPRGEPRVAIPPVPLPTPP